METSKKLRAVQMVTGKFGPGSVHVEMTGSTYTPPAETLERIDRLWAPKAAKKYTAGPLSRLEDVWLLGKILNLQFGETDFKIYSGVQGTKDLETYGYSGLPNPLSVSVAVVTSDGQILMAEKLEGDATGALDAPGGYVHPIKDLDKRKKVNIFNAAAREVTEEIIVREKKVSKRQVADARRLMTSLYCLGVCYQLDSKDGPLCHPVTSMVAVINMTSQELVVEPKPGDEVKISAFHPDEVMTRLDQSPHVEPDGRRTLALGIAYLASRTLQLKAISEI